MLIDFTTYEASTLYDLALCEASEVRTSPDRAQYESYLLPALTSIQRKLQTAIENEQDREGAKDRS